MTSTFTWLDTSEHDRRRALDVIDLLSLQTTRDELGIATIRDSLADQAPHCSTTSCSPNCGRSKSEKPNTATASRSGHAPSATADTATRPGTGRTSGTAPAPPPAARSPHPPAPSATPGSTWHSTPTTTPPSSTTIEPAASSRTESDASSDNRARLLHREYLELWSGAAGTDPLDYRWRVTQLYAREILTPLVGATKNAAKSHAQTA